MHVIEVKIIDGDVHRNLNFGEDVWRIYRGERGVCISLDEIDRAVDSFSIRVGIPSSIRLVRQKAGHHLQRHNLAAVIEINKD